MDVVTICSLEDEVNAVTHLEFEPTKQDIFGYVQDLKRALDALEETNKKLAQKDRVQFPDMYVRTRIIRAAKRVPMYKPVIDYLMTMEMAQWSAITSDQMLIRFEACRANSNSCDAPVPTLLRRKFVSILPRLGHVLKLIVALHTYRSRTNRNRMNKNHKTNHTHAAKPLPQKRREMVLALW